MYLTPKSIQVETGLLQAVAHNLSAAEAAERRQQQHAVRRTLPLGRPVQPGPPHPVPDAYAPAPEALSLQHNLGQFLQLLHSPMRSNNAYNDHTAFANAPVLSRGWLDVSPETRWHFHPGRGAWAENEGLLARMRLLLLVCGFDKKCPVLFDRTGRILDGYHRLLMAGRTWERVYFLQLDF